MNSEYYNLINIQSVALR